MIPNNEGRTRAVALSPIVLSACVDTEGGANFYRYGTFRGDAVPRREMLLYRTGIVAPLPRYMILDVVDVALSSPMLDAIDSRGRWK